MVTKMIIEPTKFNGEISVQPCKTASHVALICAFLASETNIKNLGNSQNIDATRKALQTLAKNEGIAEINCKESGATLRLLLPLVAALGIETTFTAEDTLFERSIDPLINTLVDNGAKIEVFSSAIIVKGKLHAGTYKIPGNVSSQFITALLLALPLLEETSIIEIIDEVNSAPYIENTINIQKAFGVTSKLIAPNTMEVKPQTYQKANYTVEADWNEAALFAVAGALGGSITLKGMNLDSPQGDKAILNILRDIGADIKIVDDGINITKAPLKPFIYDVKHNPDLLPILTILAAGIDGQSVINKSSDFRTKEEKRQNQLIENLKNLGCEIEKIENGIVIFGNSSLSGGEVNSYKDHKIAMALAVASSITTDKIHLLGGNAVRKSSPMFWMEFRSIGGKTTQ